MNCRQFIYASVAMLATATVAHAQLSVLPGEPIEIGATPQYFVDDYIIDNRWGIKVGEETVERVPHTLVKHGDLPLLHSQQGDKLFRAIYVNVLREQDGKFRMWYMARRTEDKQTGMGYGESEDGVQWTLPAVGNGEWPGPQQNIVYTRGGRIGGVYIIDTAEIPEKFRRGYRYIMYYKGQGGTRLVGSVDGTRWNPEDDEVIVPSFHPDHQNTFLYDPSLQAFVTYFRPADRYEGWDAPREIIGQRRRIGYATSSDLWSGWPSPQTILTPDERDVREGAARFYDFKVRLVDGIYWGLLLKYYSPPPGASHPPGSLTSELLVSRNGLHWSRMDARADLISLGSDGSWDDGMIFIAPRWVEVGEEWWFYYSGHDGEHDSTNREAGLGLATCKRGRLVSMRGPSAGGVVATRLVRWPGEDLIINAAANDSSIRVRVTSPDDRKAAITGYDYADCDAFTGDALDHRVTWKGKSLAELAGSDIRLEFWLENNADLYTFRAGMVEAE